MNEKRSQVLRLRERGQQHPQHGLEGRWPDATHWRMSGVLRGPLIGRLETADQLLVVVVQWRRSLSAQRLAVDCMAPIIGTDPVR